jgi:3D (Asp-Asp-Asp) domain-containing protein
VTLTLLTPEGPQTFQTSALTVGLALTEAGFTLYTADLFDPPAETPITGALTVTYQPSRQLVVTADGRQIQVRSAAATVGQALAEAGVPLVGLDYAVPPETAPLPEDNQIRVVHVVESVALTQKTIPFNTRTELSADLEIDQQALLQGGEPGLAIARLRTRSEDGMQVSQESEGESIVRPAQDRILGIGTKIVIRTAVVDGVTITYWRALNLFATYFIPCDPVTHKCSYGTATGKPVQKGVAAFVYPWFLLFAHERLYVPGYGFATVEDNNGANTTALVGTYWIDLGYSQTDTVDWVNQYVTVYFLTPVAANFADTYILP